MASMKDLYSVGFNDYRYSIDTYRFNDTSYIEGYESCKEYMTHFDCPRIPYADGNVLITEDIEYEDISIPVIIQKPNEYDTLHSNWNGFNNGDECVVTLYQTTRHYGGPEEGGWWYNWDSHRLSIPTLFNAKNIKMTANMLLNACGHELGGDIYSVLGGTEGWIRIERIAGSAKSTEVPHYE